MLKVKPYQVPDSTQTGDKHCVYLKPDFKAHDNEASFPACTESSIQLLPDPKCNDSSFHGGPIPISLSTCHCKIDMNKHQAGSCTSPQVAGHNLAEASSIRGGTHILSMPYCCNKNEVNQDGFNPSLLMTAQRDIDSSSFTNHSVNDANIYQDSVAVISLDSDNNNANVSNLQAGPHPVPQTTGHYLADDVNKFHSGLSLIPMVAGHSDDKPSKFQCGSFPALHENQDNDRDKLLYGIYVRSGFGKVCYL